MNREERRASGISKETADKLKGLKTPCTVLEAVQLAQGVADDKIKAYHENLNPLIVSLSLQIEVLKSMLFEGNPIKGADESFKKSLLDESKFEELFNAKVDEYNKDRIEILKKINEEIDSEGKDEDSSIPSTKVNPGEITITSSK